MKQIRQNVFETNSSSTHSICIATNAELIIPAQLTVRVGEFGWECDTLNSAEEKASYLYTGLLSDGRVNDIAKIKHILTQRGIETEFEEPKFESFGGYTYLNNGHIDHRENLGPFLDAVVINEDTLMQFLFSPLSFIITGNDNDDEDVSFSVNYPHINFYKGN